jgi:hypothetical protein
MSLLLLFHPKVSSGATVVTGAFSASATFAGTLVGGSTRAGAYSASATITGNLVGSKFAQAAFSAAATGVFKPVGGATASASWSASATGVFNAVGGSTIAGAFSATGTISFNGVGASTIEAAFQAQAELDAQFIGEDAGSATIVSAEMSGSAGISGAFVGTALSVFDWTRVSGDLRRKEEEELYALLASAWPILSHQRGKRYRSRSSSRFRGPRR